LLVIRYNKDASAIGYLTRETNKEEGKMSDVYCPIIFAQEAMNTNEEYVKCKEEKCAWWDETIKACVIMNLHQLSEETL